MKFFTMINEKWKTKWAPVTPVDDCSPGKALRVTKCDFYHSNGCFPSRNQLDVQNRRKAGTQLADLLTTEKLASIICLLLLSHTQGMVTLPFCANASQYAGGVLIDSQHINNIRLKVMIFVFGNIRSKIQSQVSSQYMTQRTFYCKIILLLLMIRSSLLPALFVLFHHSCSQLSAELPADFIDQSSRMIRELLKEALSEGNDTMYILRLLESIHKADPRFTYCVARNSEGQECGFMWMTPVMRTTHV
jgi:hypothetical protein